MRTYLVTGGAGFIGSNYIHYMFRKYGDSIRIINVDCLTYAGNLENLKSVEDRENYTFINANICDSEAIGKIFAENEIDRVVHFAAESHVDRSIKDPEIFVKTNVLGTLVMLNAAKVAWELEDGSFKADKKFLHVSTDEVYGSLEEEGTFFYETTPLDPHSPYSASKASSDMLVKSYIDTYHFPANITNCSNNYEADAFFCIQCYVFTVIVSDNAGFYVFARHVGRSVHMCDKPYHGSLLRGVGREGGEKIPVVVKNDLFKSHVFEKTFEVFCKFHLTRSGGGHIGEFIALCVESHEIKKAFGYSHDISDFYSSCLWLISQDRAFICKIKKYPRKNRYNQTFFCNFVL